MQVCVLGGVAFIFCSLTLWLAPPSIKPTLTQVICSCLLLLGGYTWMNWLQTKFQRQLWPLIWAQILERIHAGLSWGRSFSQILNDDLNELPERLPELLARTLHQCALNSKRALSLGEIFLDSNQDAATMGSKPRSKERAREQLAWLAKLYDQGQSLSVIAGRLSEFTMESLESELEKLSQTLAMQSLMPLFVCGLPAILILIFGGIIRALRNF